VFLKPIFGDIYYRKKNHLLRQIMYNVIFGLPDHHFQKLASVAVIQLVMIDVQHHVEYPAKFQGIAANNTVFRSEKSF
jgi:hypothetical protein